MPWTLEIHHIDVGQGDSTLIVAREAALGLVRSVLIDAGLQNQAPHVHAYITNPAPAGAGLAALDVLVVTHYDRDHFNGVTQLLRNNAGTYDNTLIFDQGWPGGGLEQLYERYVMAINGRNGDGTAGPALGGGPLNRTRITRNVLSYGVAPTLSLTLRAQQNTAAVPLIPPGGVAHIAWVAANTLLNNPEVMWTNAAGLPNNALWGGAMAPAPGLAGGPPMLRCIAVNEFVEQVGGGSVQIPSGILNPNSETAKNARSLAFMLQFEGFRYYIGGDISSVQEDDPNNVGNGIGGYLAAQGQTHAMKASHHGSGESTSNGFIAQLQPASAIFSFGADNDYGFNPANAAGQGPWPKGHPQQRVLDDLEAAMVVDNYYFASDRSGVDFCRRLNRGVGVWQQAYTGKAIVAGGWGPPLAGWGAATAGTNTCSGQWPNDGAPAQQNGNIVIDVTAAGAAAGPPTYTVTVRRPAIQMPVLNVNVQLPAGVIWPAPAPALGRPNTLPTNTELPQGSVWPGGAGAPLQGMTVQTAFVLAAALPWPNGQTLMAGVIRPGAGAANMQGWMLPAVTILPAGIIWSAVLQLPPGAILPAGAAIPANMPVPNPAGLVPGAVLAVPVALPPGVMWPAGVALPPIQFPAVTIFPAGSTWPAGVALTAVTPPMATTLPIGTTLPVGFVFPAGATWPVGAGLPHVALPAGKTWPAGQALPVNTMIPAGATLAFGIQWPIGVAIPVPAGVPAAMATLINNH